MLDEWAGSPPAATELIRRLGQWQDLDALGQFLAAWESWAAELLESHISYPVLARFRSQHGNESWVASLTTILDTCAQSPARDRLSADDLRRLRGVLHEAGVVLRTGDEADRKLVELRRSYEPYVAALARGLLLTLPPWLPSAGAKYNWQKSAWL